MYFTHLYENRTVRPVEIVLSGGRWRRERMMEG
jgi:hypothetical protein